jgi:O-antigen ligase
MGAAGAAGVVVAGLSTLAIQLAVVLGAAVVTASMMMARAGRVLNPAWLIVAWLYLVGLFGSLLNNAGIGLSTAGLVLMAPSPFVIAAVLMRPQSLERLLLLAPLGLLVGLAGLSLLWSPDSPYGSDKLTLWILTGVLPAACILILTSGSSGISWRLIGAVACLYALGIILFGGAAPLYPGRATIFDANPIWAGRAVFIGALVVLFGPFPWFAKLTMAPVMIVAGLTTISLGPALGLLVGVWVGVAETLRCADRHDERVVVGWIALLLATGVAVVLVAGGVLDPLLARLAVDPNISSRAIDLAAAGRLFLQAPLLGVGFGGFSSTGLDVYPHNIFAEVGGELGVLGVFFLLAWLGLALRGAARSPILVALVSATAVFALFSGDLAGNAELWMFSALAVAMLPVRAGGVVRDDTGRRPMTGSSRRARDPMSLPRVVADRC